MQASPGGSSPRGVTPQGPPSSSASVLAPVPETAPAPAPALAAPQATSTGTNRYAMQPGVTRAGTRSQVRSPVATDFRANQNNRASLPRLFQQDTLEQVHKLGSHANLDIAHQLDDVFSAEYAYATTNTHGSFSAGEITEKSPTHSRRLSAFHKRRVRKRHLTETQHIWKSTACTSWYQSPQTQQDRGCQARGA